jgi:hypothetical protein
MRQRQEIQEVLPRLTPRRPSHQGQICALDPYDSARRRVLAKLTFALRSTVERIDKLTRFSLPVPTEGAFGKRGELGARLVASAEANEGDGVVVARLEGESAMGVLLQVSAPCPLRGRRVVVGEVSAVRRGEE